MIFFDRFLELGAILEPGKTPKMDKSAILNDAIRVVGELRSEAKKLKDSNESLQEKIKELKVYTISYDQVINGAVQMGMALVLSRHFILLRFLDLWSPFSLWSFFFLI